MSGVHTGKGEIVELRDDGMYEVLLDFDGSPYKAYVNKDAVKYAPDVVGTCVSTPYGLGTVKSGLYPFLLRRVC